MPVKLAELKPGVRIRVRAQDGTPFSMRAEVRSVINHDQTVICKAITKMWPHRVGDVLTVPLNRVMDISTY